MIDQVIAAIESCCNLPLAERIAVYNAATRALAKMAGMTDPACAPQLIAPAFIAANDYNPNKVASPEMRLLEDSIRADGVTMCVVVTPGDDGGFVVVDGFHRRAVTTALGYQHIPCAVIDSERGDRMASTVRHNRARGKHQIDLMGAIVREMLALEWSDADIATHLGMSAEELLRLKQIVGCAKLLAGQEYSQSWAVVGP